MYRLTWLIRQAIDLSGNKYNTQTWTQWYFGNKTIILQAEVGLNHQAVKVDAQKTIKLTKITTFKEINLVRTHKMAS